MFAAALSDADTCRRVLEIILGEKIPPMSVHAEYPGVCKLGLYASSDENAMLA